MLLNFKNQNKGFIIPLVIAIVVLVIIGVVYFGNKNKGHDSEFDVNPAVSEVTIMVPENIPAYIKAMDEFVSQGGTDPVKTWKFVELKVRIATTSDVIPAMIEAAAKVIPAQGGQDVAYLRGVGETTYVLLGMDIDGWAGVSFAIAKIHPIVERTLLNTSGTKEVKFSPAPGDTIESVTRDYYKLFQIESTSTEPVPVISSIIPTSASIGDTIEIKGSHFSGFEGDKYAWIENSAGKKGIIYGDYKINTDSSIRFKLENKYCTKDNSYTGNVCAEYLNITPGTYSVYVMPWGKMSNKVKLVVDSASIKPTQSSVTKPYITVISPNNNEVLKIGDPISFSWKTNVVLPVNYWLVVYPGWGGSIHVIHPSSTTTMYRFDTRVPSGYVTGDLLGDVKPGQYKTRVVLYEGVRTCKPGIFCNDEEIYGKLIVDDTAENFITITN